MTTMTVNSPSSQQAPDRHPGRFRRSMLLFLTILSVGAALVLPWAINAPRAFAAVDPPLCTGTACTGTNPYDVYCAGQTWDAWNVVATAPLQDQQHHKVGTVTLWWSQTCQTYWSSVTFHVPAGTRLLYAESRVAVAGVGNQARLGFDRTVSTLLSPQEYAPASQAAAHGLVMFKHGARLVLYSGCAMQSPDLCS